MERIEGFRRRFLFGRVVKSFGGGGGSFYGLIVQSTDEFLRSTKLFGLGLGDWLRLFSLLPWVARLVYLWPAYSLEQNVPLVSHSCICCGISLFDSSSKAVGKHREENGVLSNQLQLLLIRK